MRRRDRRRETSSTAQTVPAATGTEIRQTVRIDNPHLWNGVVDPYLHHASVEIHDVTAGGDRVTDVVTERLGLRSLAVDAPDGARSCVSAPSRNSCGTP
ncbi:hypothetical protein WB401_07690 [Streptomyces brasiliscabiei]|uniref:Glycoside hydrolase family 2 immunoglobulin-like beta-sandwich domain-containing protein n=1 Tax=Streptomyces brasiliscabiei TaxID=2736302 RepID=A0ABU8G3J5_9ACTN